MSSLLNKRIVLGVTGSIACYKAVDLASKLTQAGAQVEVILTTAAARFVAPITFQSVTGRPAYADGDLWGAQAHVLHVGLGHKADLLAVIPTTANTIAKLAHGEADNLLTVTALAATCPLLIAPAMDAGMFSHPATAANVATLAERGAVVVGPEEGHLASGLIARGRLTEPTELLGRIRHLLAQGGSLTGRKVVVTAGGTREAIDPVRYITNRSSGKQGYALAQAALDAGADVTLISAAQHLPTPTGARFVAVNSAQEMTDAVLHEAANADTLIMAAAVADFRPAQIADQKIKKQGGMATIELTRTQDILVAVKAQREEVGHPLMVVGFAAETENVLANAGHKLARKGLDMIVANDVSASDAGFAVDSNRVTLLRKDGSSQTMPLMSKAAVAAKIIDEVIVQLSALK